MNPVRILGEARRIKIDTKYKIRLATVAYRIVSFARLCLGKGDRAEVKRGAVDWELDLREGIDFSIYLLGGFEPRTLRLYTRLLGKKACEVVLDIGANIGAHSLPLAQLVVPKGGKVYAFEPTAYAYGKLLNNIALNPSIGFGVAPVQAMLVAEDCVAVEQEIYSSWPLCSENALHAGHGGRLKATTGAQAFSLDSFVRIHDITRIDFIKLDVDGNEPSVIAGSWQTLQRFHPMILMEWACNLSAEHHDTMRQVLSRLLQMGYGLFDGSSGKLLSGGIAELDRRTPSKGSMNILLRFGEA